MSRPATLGQLRESGWESVPVKAEIRRNAIEKIRNSEPLFPGVLGYDENILPQLENALLAGHDVIFLGERGQAKTRMIRSLIALLDEYMPVIAGSEINDDPYAPVSRHSRDLVREHGDDTQIEWVHHDTRFGEKLATPDTSIADLIGEVDPIKVAEGRYLSDELTLHYGLVPRTNRGIFAINELPDLAERIQVGLLNVLEERDVQVRGYKIRLPIDIMLVASANPEDYTNRGRIITPLKDRFGAQIRTHYPLDLDVEVAIAKQEVHTPSADGVRVYVPEFMTDIVATLSQLARQSPHINQRSGVSVRLTVSNSETLVANAMRRALRHNERDVVPRVSDLEALASSTAGKVEIEALEEGRDEQIVQHLLRTAVLTVFKDRIGADTVREVVGAFEGGKVVHTGEDVTAADEAKIVGDVTALRQPVASLTNGDESPAAVASAVEFILEGLHLSKRLNKDAVGARATYRFARVTDYMEAGANSGANSAWPAVVIRGLWKRFDAKIAVAGIDLDVPRGCFFGLVGPNGAGKTTTIRMLTGLLRPDFGQIWIEARDVWQDQVGAKTIIGVLPDEFKLFDRLSGAELLEYSGLLRGMPPDVVKVRRDELLHVLELTEAADTFVVDYSTGMRKKIALAAALLHSPDVLFLDEPFESVDPLATRTIRHMLERFTDGGGTVLFSSHVMEVVERLCDRVGVMHQGRLIAEGPTDQLHAGRRLEDVFADLVGARVADDGALAWLQAGRPVAGPG